MFKKEDILYEDNHLMVVNKRVGDLVQPDPSGGSALETEIKEFIRIRDAKPGAVFLGVVHRLDRPVSGVVAFAKTSKALVRMNELVRDRKMTKTYWAITENAPEQTEGEMRGNLVRNGKTNLSRIVDKPTKDSKEAILEYKVLGKGTKYYLIEVLLITGRHHQIRARLNAAGCPIKGDLKYGAARSNPGGGISLHARAVEFAHPVKGESLKIVAPTPEGDNLWGFFEQNF